MQEATSGKVRQEYKRLFSLPSIRKILLYSLIEVFIFSLFTAIAVNPFFLEFNSVLSLALIYAIQLYVIIPFLVLLRKRTILDLRRSIGLSALMNGIIGTTVIISGVTKALSSFISHGIILAGYGIATCLFAIVIYSTSFVSAIYAFFTAIIPSTAAYLSSQYISSLMPLKELTAMQFELSMLLFDVVGLFSVLLVTNAGKKIMKKSTLDAFRGFVFAWTERIREPIEEFFEKVAVEKEIPIGTVIFRSKASKKIDLIWLISNIHPGPFINVGSSDLPQRFTNFIRKKFNCNGVFFHGTCCHEENLPSQRVSDYFLENCLLRIISEEIKSGNFVSKATPIVKISSRDIHILGQKFGNILITAVTKSPLTMDDISLDVGLMARKIKQFYGIDGLLIDTHNSLDNPHQHSTLTIQTQDADKILEGIKLISQKIIAIEPSDRIRLGFSRIFREEIGIEEGMGPDGIAVTLIEVDDRGVVYVNIDSNNLKQGVRDKIVEFLKERYKIHEVEVFTTDTHVVNAVSPKEGAYTLIDMRWLNKIKKTLVAGMNNAIRDLHDVEISSRIDLIRVPVLGESTEKLENHIIWGANIFRRNLLEGLLFSILISFILVML
ncbi:MAG: DUF2070 family protein [Candidatus Njordarchaeales archaeon]